MDFALTERLRANRRVASLGEDVASLDSESALEDGPAHARIKPGRLSGTGSALWETGRSPALGRGSRSNRSSAPDHEPRNVRDWRRFVEREQSTIADGAYEGSVRTPRATSRNSPRLEGTSASSEAISPIPVVAHSPSLDCFFTPRVRFQEPVSSSTATKTTSRTFSSMPSLETPGFAELDKVTSVKHRDQSSKRMQNTENALKFIPSQTSLEMVDQKNAELVSIKSQNYEQLERLAAVQKDREASLASEITRLKAKLERLDEDAKMSRQAAIDATTKCTEMEERCVRLEAERSVLESRLDAAARRNASLQLQLSCFEGSEYALAMTQTKASCDDCEASHKEIQVLHNEIASLRERESALVCTLRDLEENKKEATWARVAYDRLVNDLQRSIETISAESKAHERRCTDLAHERNDLTEKNEKLISDLANERSKIEELERLLKHHETRVRKSEASFASRKLLSTVESSLADLESIVSLVESSLSGASMNLDQVLGVQEALRESTPESMDTRETKVNAAFTLLAERVREARSKAIEALAKGSRTENPKGDDSLPDLSSQACHVQ